MRRLCFASLLTACLFTFTAWSQGLPGGVRKVTTVEGITEYSLPNGLRLLLFPDPSSPKVTVNMTYLVGSRHEGYGETGMAHLLEHMLFKKSKGGRDVAKELADHGAAFNGTTAYDRTNYFETVTANDENLHWAIQLEADRMVNMPITKAALDTEMTVVRNELESGENNPGVLLRQRVLSAAFMFHNYGKAIIGTRSDVENVPAERLEAFYQKYYEPDNVISVIAGKFDEGKALAWSAESFGAIPRPTRELHPNYTVEPPQDGERMVTLRRVGDNPIVALMYHIPAESHPDYPALEVLGGILGGGPGSRLYKALVAANKAAAAPMNASGLHDPGFLMSMITLRADQSIDEARDTLLKTVEGVVTEPPSKEEVDRIKTRYNGQLELGLSNSQGAALALSEYAADGDWRLLFLNRDRLRNVTPEDVARVAKAYLKPSNRTMGEFIPTKTPDNAIIPATPDLAATLKDYKGGAGVQPGEAFDPSPANIESRVMRETLPSGLKLSLLSKKTRGGTVLARIRLDFGDIKSLSGKGAIGGFMGQMMPRGTTNKTRQQLQDEMDKLKAPISISGGSTTVVASFETQEANFAAAFRLAVEMLREPTFPEDEFKQIKTQRLAGLENGRSQPNSKANSEYARLLNLYPRGDVRHQNTLDEEIEDIQKVTIEDVRQFYKQFVGASNAYVSAVGQFDAAAAKKMASELLSDWKSPGHFEEIVGEYHKFDPVNIKIETPDKANAVFSVRSVLRMTDKDPDYAALELAGYILGGGPGSRLMNRIRVKEGLSYGVSAFVGIPSLGDRATFDAQAISNPANAPKVEASFLDEVAQVLKNGFTADEVEKAKKAYLDRELVGRSQDGSLLTTLTVRARLGRTLKWDEDFDAAIAKLTPDQVSAAFRKHIDPSAFLIVKAGDFKAAGVFQ